MNSKQPGAASESQQQQQQVQAVVTFTGTAMEGKVGPPLGLIDIGISESAYLFRVPLPGVRSNLCNLMCHIQTSGRVEIEGVITGSDVLKNKSTEYRMTVEQLSPPGRFQILFNLPGAVDTRLASQNFRNDGILEVVVMKYRIPIIGADGYWFPPS